MLNIKKLAFIADLTIYCHLMAGRYGFGNKYDILEFPNIDFYGTTIDKDC
jgi:hypothetical protein